MSSTLSELRRLQEIELQLVTIRRNREAKTRRVEVQRNRARQAEIRFNENHAAVQSQQMRIDEFSLEIATHEESVEKHRTALNKAKTNNEYAAVLTALNTEKADNLKLETSVFQMMDELSKVKSAGAELETEWKKTVSDVAAAEEALRLFDTESDSELKRLQSERESFARSIEPAILSLFDRAAQRHEGEAMATVVKLRPRGDEWACAGCNMKLTLEIVNSLATRDDVKMCGVCGRIMYLERGEVKARG